MAKEWRFVTTTTIPAGEAADPPPSAASVLADELGEGLRIGGSPVRSIGKNKKRTEAWWAAWWTAQWVADQQSAADESVLIGDLSLVLDIIARHSAAFYAEIDDDDAAICLQQPGTAAGRTPAASSDFS